jgi:nickel/cobalt transporter (NiCoT) family protein
VGGSSDISGRHQRLRRLFGALTPAEIARLLAMTAVVVGLFVLGFSLLFAASPHHYRISKTQVFGIGTGILALTLGMRHAFDADHIAAIDNTTRKLMAEGKRPLSVGFFFSLGHSSVVLALAVALNFGVTALAHQVRDGGSELHRLTTVVGTSVSAIFLYVIAAINVVVLVSVVRALRDLRRGVFDEQELERRLDQRGLMNRFFGPLARRIDTPWKIYPIGVLFGLGFDTATEVALLVVSGTAVAGGLPFWAVLSLPILFAAGMSLLDTIDGCFMNFAYGWAFSRPVRKVFYNVVITGLSVAAAFVVGTIELLEMFGSELGWGGSFRGALQSLNINTAGFVIVGMFVLTWTVAMAVWRFGRIESKWETQSSESRSRVLAAEAHD